MSTKSRVGKLGAQIGDIVQYEHPFQAPGTGRNGLVVDRVWKVLHPTLNDPPLWCAIVLWEDGRLSNGTSFRCLRVKVEGGS